MRVALRVFLLSVGLVAPTMAFEAEDELGNWFGVTSRITAVGAKFDGDLSAVDTVFPLQRPAPAK